MLQNDFENYLKALNLSPKTLKNYKSDVSHFVSWAILKVRSFGSYVESLAELIPFLGSNLANDYKNYMAGNSIPAKTVNRRLSTLRHLSKFLVQSQAIDQDFTVNLQNLSFGKTKVNEVNPIIDEFRSYLVAERVSPNTIKNYLSDIRQFINWIETAQQ